MIRFAWVTDEEKKPRPTKLAINVQVKDKICLSNGTEARVVEKHSEEIWAGGKHSLALVIFICNTKTKKGIRTIYFWNDLVKLPYKQEARSKLPWLSGLFERWLKKLEVKPEW